VDPRCDEALDRALFDLYERHVIRGQLRAPLQHDVAGFSREAANETFWQIMNSIARIDDQLKSQESRC
jgi:hypothetical protein